MAEYIERESLINHVEDLPTWGTDGDMLDRQDVIGSIENRPAADVVPVRHGRWDDSGRYTFPGGSTAVRCTECGCALTVSEYHLNNWNYCPVCGAKMDGGETG